MSWNFKRRALMPVIGWLAMTCAAPAHALSTCTVSITCVTILSLLLPLTYTIALSPSTTSGTMSRAMAGPSSERLQYNLYTNNSRSIVWGDGSGGSQTVTGSVTPSLLSVGVVGSHTVYGAITARQIVRPGSYLSILVTVNY